MRSLLLITSSILQFSFLLCLLLLGVPAETLRGRSILVEDNETSVPSASETTTPSPTSLLLPTVSPTTFVAETEIVEEEEEEDDEEEDVGSDESILNRIIAFLLPHVNNIFRSLVADPLDLNMEGNFNIGEINLLFCWARLDMNYDFGRIVGLKNLSVESLRVVPGTERINPGCLETFFNGIFEMTISSRDMFRVQDFVAGIDATGCGVTYSDSVNGGVNTYQPTLRGAVNISGLLSSGGIARIDVADMMGNVLDVSYNNIEAYLDGFPDSVNTFLTNVTTEITRSMDFELHNTVEPTINPTIQESLMNREARISTREFIGLNARFVRNDVQRKMVRFLDNTKNFTRSIFNFGLASNDDEVGDESGV